MNLPLCSENRQKNGAQAPLLRADVKGCESMLRVVKAPKNAAKPYAARLVKGCEGITHARTCANVCTPPHAHRTKHTRARTRTLHILHNPSQKPKSITYKRFTLHTRLHNPSHPGNQLMPGEICLTTLPPNLKRTVWEAIKAERPDLADLLGSDGARELVRRFQGRVSVAWADLPENARQALRAAGRA